jgi:CBS domain-containing protein
VKAREALVSDPRVVAPDAPLEEVAAILVRPQVETVFVVDGDRLAGCVTTHAIVAALADGRDVASLSAGDLADPGVTTVGPETLLEEALHVMAEEGLERLPVVEDGRLLGVLPREPLVRRLAEDEPPPAPEDI